MNRCSAISEGFIKFPLDSREFSNSGDGGMVVKLVVMEQDSLEGLDQCRGGSVYDLLEEGLVGDSGAPVPDSKLLVDLEGAPPEQILAAMEADNAAQVAWVRNHFPRYQDPEARDQGTYGELISRHYRAVVVMGTTGWSGHSKAKGYWVATKESLSPYGTALWNQLQELNPGCDLRLLTFLDT